MAETLEEREQTERFGDCLIRQDAHIVKLESQLQQAKRLLRELINYGPCHMVDFSDDKDFQEAKDAALKFLADGGG